MGAGEYLSDDAVGEFDKIKRYREHPLLSGLLMFVSYVLAGFTHFPRHRFCLNSVFFALGFIEGKLLKVSPIRRGLKILIIGGFAIILGLLLGFAFKLK